MEDRAGTGLYLELASELTAPEYEAQRVGEMLALDGVERATWWDNLCPLRTDLPRVIDEFVTLGAHEVTETFRTDTVPAMTGITGHHFRRTARPGQGRLMDRPTLGLSLVLIAPTSPDLAQALRDWGDFVHISAIAAASVPGYTMITPYENALGVDTPADDPRYLHLYEMDTADAEQAFQSMTPLVAERLGGRTTPEFRDWAWHDSLRIIYVNSFRRVGERRRRSP